MKTASALAAVSIRPTKRRRRRVALRFATLTIGILASVPVEAGVFMPTGSLREARENHTATFLANGKVLVAGGYGTNALGSAELYDPDTGTWTPTGGFFPARSYHTATLLPNGKVLVAGGAVDRRSFAGAELYDPAAGTWTATRSLNIARDGHTATLLPNGKVLVVGGEWDNGTNFFTVGSTELYDPATGIWTLNGPLNEARELHTATLLPNGRVLVAGGFDYDTNPVQKDTAELYDASTGTWSFTGSLRDRRSSHTATLLANGKVLVAGGGEWGAFSGVIPLSSAELYDPATASWTPTGDSAAERWQPTANLLANGHVLLAGGGDSIYFPFASAEEYDPFSGQWSLVSNMMTNRIWQTATTLIDGKVLLAGGYYYLSHSLRSAEMYDPGIRSGAGLATIADAKILPDGSFRIGFTNTPNAPFSVLAATFPTLPSTEWMALGGVREISPGQFQFTDTEATHFPQRFYRLRSP